jgi:hypothetical protein
MAAIWFMAGLLNRLPETHYPSLSIAAEIAHSLVL